MIGQRGHKKEIFDKNHREIYISDFRKTSQEKLKTVLRYIVEDK